MLEESRRPTGSGPEPPPNRLRPAIVLLAVLTIVVVAYAGALDAPLLWDDLPLLEHPSVQHLRPPGEYLLVPFWDLREDSPGTLAFYRPLTTFSLALDAAVHGRNATGFHLTNLLLHLGNVACVFFLARRLRAHQLAAGATALGWALLPRLAESVSWVSGRTDELGAMGVLGALLVWEKGNRRRLALASLLAVVGMLGKEMGMAGALALAVGEFWPRPVRAARLGGLVPLGCLGVYLGLRTMVMGPVAGPAPISLSGAARVPVALEAIGRYVWMTLDPWHPRTQIGLVGHPAVSFILIGVLALSAAAVVAWRYARQLDALPAAIVVAGIVPVLLVIHIVPLPWVAVAGDRLMYLPWALLAVAIASGCQRLRLGAGRQLALGTGYVGLTVSLLVALHARVRTFANEVEFWVDAVETTPAANWGPSLSLLGLYQRGGLYPQALEVIEHLDGREPSPARVGLPRYLARALARVGRYQQAYQVARASTADHPSPREVLDTSVLALHVFDLREAETLAREAERALPGYPRAREVLHAIASVRELRQRIESDPPGGLEGELIRARLTTFAGRGVEAEQAWLVLLQDPRLSEPDADEGFAFLAQAGTKDALAKAIERYSSRPRARPELLLAARDRLAFAELLLREWPRTLRALERLQGQRQAAGSPP
jgi:hypothetical protein